MTSRNPKSLVKFYKYNNMRLSSTEMDVLTSTAVTLKPLEELPFEVELPENSPHRKNIPEETLVKESPDEKIPLGGILMKEKKLSASDTVDFIVYFYLC